jgi:hypothetical protein
MGLGMVSLALEKLGRLEEMVEPLTKAVKLMETLGHPHLSKYTDWLARVRGEI